MTVPFLTLEITDLGARGEGIGKINDFVYFVRGGIPGDIIEFQLLQKKKNFGIGKLQKIIKTSPLRITPPCLHAERCGGCQIQAMAYQDQLRFKEKILKESLLRIGKIDHMIQPIIGMQNPYYYRNKAQFVVGQVKNKVQIGLYSIYSHNIVDIENCLIVHKNTNEILTILKEFFNKNNTSIYNENLHRGLIRHVIIRNSFTNNETMLILVINGDNYPDKELLLEKLKLLSHFSGFFLNINKEKGDKIFGEKSNLVWGNPYLEEEITHIKFKIGPTAFFQINPFQVEKLVNLIQNLCFKQNKKLNILDAYCGMGLFSLCLSKFAEKIIGIEVSEEAITSAKINSELNKISNVDFYCGEVEKILPQIISEQKSKFDLVIFDPPRKGCDQKFLDFILKIKPNEIIYVSCNPATLARDLKILDLNYQIELIQPIDLFPHTMHLETIIYLKSK